MFLIGFLTFSTIVVILEVAVALGLVIFVHELGHFLVAKLCGVKCEKFYLGFDIYGLKLAKFQWGETEYGIGVLPLGGYVKMLGQEDNPTKAYEEIQRARNHHHDAPPPPVEGWAADRTEESEGTVYDPRSYLAQSVPRRMAIISAGVVMNLIFAVFLGALAYGIGVKYQPCIISGLVPGQPAWRANLQVGDQIVAIGNLENPRYTDLLSSVTLGNLETGLPLTIKRQGQPVFTETIRPTQELRPPKIGVSSPQSLKLAKKTPTEKGTPAASAEPALKGGDILTAANGHPLSSYADFDRILAQNRDQPLEIQVRRAVKPATEQSKTPSTENVTTTLAPNPVRDFGLRMAMGPIVAVQENSLAQKAGFQPQDHILAIDGQPVGDPMTLPDRLYRRAGETVTFTLQRAEEPPRDIPLEVPLPTAYEWPKLPVDNVPMEISGLGVAYRVLNRVEAVEPDSPAAKAGIKPGDVLAAAAPVPPQDERQSQSWWSRLRDRQVKPIAFGDKHFNWPFVMALMQHLPEGTQLQLTLADNREVSMTPVPAKDWFNPARGLILEPLYAERRAESVREAFVLGGRETLDATLQVYRFLQKIGHQVPVTEIGGPVSIAAVAGSMASSGFSDLLMFLVLLSANLAVLNFLPIPMLDGGHMVFLILEGIRRKPVSEKVVLAFHYAGFLFLITLMCFALFLDFRRFLL